MNTKYCLQSISYTFHTQLKTKTKKFTSWLLCLFHILLWTAWGSLLCGGTFWFKSINFCERDATRWRPMSALIPTTKNTYSTTNKPQVISIWKICVSFESLRISSLISDNNAIYTTLCTVLVLVAEVFKEATIKYYDMWNDVMWALRCVRTILRMHKLLCVLMCCAF